MRGKLSIPLTIMILLSVTVAGIGAITTVDSTGYLAFDKELVYWETGAEPADLSFDLSVNITDVFNLTGCTFSVHWNSTLLDCTKFTAGDFLPKSTAENATGWMITWDKPAGNMSEAANSLLATALPEQRGTVALPSWGWIANLTFKYIGKPPAIGYPNETDIIIVNQPDAAMSTCWQEDWGPWHDFDDLSPPYVHKCHFKYKAVPMPVKPPKACFTYTPPSTIMTYDTPVNITVYFDATCSEKGCDGDLPYTDIKFYEWEVGDGTLKFNTTSPYMNHTYIWTPPPNYKEFWVRLVVYAPGIPPYIDGAYDPKSAEYKDVVKIAWIPPTYIDVYTETERWPGYITDVIGEGPDMPADAYYPQEQVTLFAVVMYKGDVVQNKLVSFEVVGPDNPYQFIYLVRTAYTDKNGIATISFRIPWPCEHGEEIIFGRNETEQHRPWTVYATVMLGTHETETKFEDTLTFLVGYTVELVSAITIDVDTGEPKDTFQKCQCVGVKLTIKNIAEKDRLALIVIVIYDDAGCVVARFATWLTLKPSTTVVPIKCVLPVPKWAMVGPYSMVYANAFTRWPEGCGVAWCPEVSHPITIEKGVCDP